MIMATLNKNRSHQGNTESGKNNTKGNTCHGDIYTEIKWRHGCSAVLELRIRVIRERVDVVGEECLLNFNTGYRDSGLVLFLLL